MPYRLEASQAAGRLACDSKIECYNAADRRTVGPHPSTLRPMLRPLSLRLFLSGAALLIAFCANVAVARVVQLRVERHEPVLNGKSFGLAGPYEKLVGRVEFALDPLSAPNVGIVDLGLAPRNRHGEVEFTADFYMLKPVDPSRGNGRLFYEVCNRGGKDILRTFQKARNSPVTPRFRTNSAMAT